MQGCNTGTTLAGCETLRAGGGIWQVVISPDGRHAYGIAYSTHALLIFDRDVASGALTQRGAGGCLSETGSDGQCVRAKGLLYPVGITMSPDGRNVYVASPRSTPDGDAYAGGGVAVFTRNPASGDLSQPAGAAACVSFNTATGGAPTTGGACTKGRGMTAVTAVTISPDGRHVYAGGHSLAVLDRDPNTGVLTQPAGETGCFNEVAGEGCTPARGLAAGMSTRQIAISPDSRSVYVPDEANNALVVLDRDPASGRLVQKPGAAGCFGVNSMGGACALESKLGGVRSAVVSPDGNQVYVSANGAMLVFARYGDGALAPQSCISDPSVLGCTPGRNIWDLTFNAVSPDGQAVVASNQSSGLGMVIFDRDGAGNLTQPAGIDGCVSVNGTAHVRDTFRPNECVALGTQYGHGSVSFYGDGSLTVASHHANGSVTAFKRDLFPVCRDQGVTITQNTTVPLGFACADRNGDAMSFEITRQSLSGALGAVDQASGRVFYSPFANYLGGDALTYRAVAAGLPSNEATVALSVVPPATPPAPAVRPRTVTSPVTYNWSVRRSRLTLRQLVVRRLPVGATVTLTCSGKRCPFSKRTVKRSRKSTMNVLNAKSLKGRKTFRAGQTVDIRVEVPGMNTKLLRFKLRTGKVPKHQNYCVPVGTKKARRTCS